MPSPRPAENFCAELVSCVADSRRPSTKSPRENKPSSEPPGRDGAVTGAALLWSSTSPTSPPSSNYPTARLEWTYWTAANLPRYIHQVPTIVVSIANPYHLQDVPRVKTYINAYASDLNTITALVDKLTGLQDFTGIQIADVLSRLIDGYATWRTADA